MGLLRFSTMGEPHWRWQGITPPPSDPALRLHHETARVTPEQRKEMLGRVLSQMLQGRRVGLVCSCAPKACHGDVIAAKLVRMYCEIASP